MSKTVTFCNTSDEFYKVTKTYANNEQKSVEIVYPCSLTRPVLKIKGGKIDKNYIRGLFSRNYWIVNQTLDNGINYITCAVDAFTSFSGNIYGSTQFVIRSETQGNVNINDPLFPCTSEPISQVKKGSLLTQNVTYVIGVI